MASHLDAATDNVYGTWPCSGEIDIMKDVGLDPHVIMASAHTFSYNQIQGTQNNRKLGVPDCYTKFHIYALEWEADEYQVYEDNQLYFTFRNEKTGSNEWPFDQLFHLLLNLAVGGSWGGMKGIDDSIFPASMEVDYVRVYKKR